MIQNYSTAFSLFISFNICCKCNLIIYETFNSTYQSVPELSLTQQIHRTTLTNHEWALFEQQQYKPQLSKKYYALSQAPSFTLPHQIVTIKKIVSAIQSEKWCTTVMQVVCKKKHGFVVFFPCLSSIPQILWVVARSIAYTVDQPSIQVYLHKMPSCIFSIRFPLHSCWLALIYVITKDRDPSRRIPQKLLASNCDRTQILLVHN